MDQLIRAMVKFDASHIDTTRTRCTRKHGHRWKVTAEKRSSVGGGDDNLEVDLEAIVIEWVNRDLNEMLHTDSVSVEALAAWTCERLLLRHPTIVRVEFSDGRATGIVTQELRR